MSFRGFVIALMTVLFLAFTSAETRAVVLTKMAEETGAGRFYEDKAHTVHQDVVRLGQMQGSRDPEEWPLPALRPLVIPARPAFTTHSRSTASPRAPPHQPRAPPVTA